MPELWRKRKNGKPVGSWLVTLDKRRINTLTKDANLARERARMAEAGMWPPPKGMSADEAHEAYEQDVAAAAADSALEATDPTRGGTMANGAQPSGGEPAAHNTTQPVPGSSPGPSTSSPPAPAPTVTAAPSAPVAALPPIGASSAVQPDEVIPPGSAASDAAAAAAEATGASSSDDEPAAPAGSSLDDLLSGFGMTRTDLVELLGLGHALLCDKLANLVASSEQVSNDATKAVQKFAGPAALACIEKRLQADVQLSPEWMLVGATLAGVGVRVLTAPKKADASAASSAPSSSATNGSDGKPTNIPQPVTPSPDWTAGLNIS